MANEFKAKNGLIAPTIQSTVSTGTAPLTVASTTLVANLNVTSLNSQNGAFYQNASNLNAGTVAFARLDAANDTGGEFPISDRRALGDVSPDSYRDKAVTFSFSDDYPTLSTWGSAITMKGWSDGYYAWQLASYSNNSASATKENLFFRTGVSAAWNTIRKIWDSGNDGTSSGLDADLLDGYDSVDFPRKAENAVISGAWDFNGDIDVGATYSLSFGSGTRQMLNLWSTTYGLGVQSNTLYSRAATQFAWHRGGVHSNTALDPGAGGVLAMYLDSSSNLVVTGTAQGTRLISTITTGTAPLTVSSTTTVTNLNADLLDGVQGADYTRADLTYLGKTGNLSFDSATNTAAEWSALPVGYARMFSNATGTAGGAPLNNYGYFLKVANRDSSGGWGGLWAGYGTGENYIGRSADNTTFATWDLLWSSANDGAGSGLDADQLDGQQGTYYLAFSNFTGTASTAQIANNAVDNTKIRDSAALSVIGNATNSSADPADITASTDHFVLRRSGTALGFGLLIGDNLTDNSITGAKLADYSVTGSKISDGTVNSDKIDTSDTYNWFGPHSFKSDLNVDGVMYWNNTSAKLTQAVTVTTDNGSSWWFNLVNSGKTAGLLLYPLVPSVTITANDGAGNYSTIGMSSGGMNFQFVGTADLAVNGTVAALNEVIVGQGNDTPPKLVHLCPPIRYRWTDFESASVQMTSPYIGAAISSGDSATIPPTAFFVAGTQGLLMARSSSTTNSGYRWITEYSDRIVGQADLYFRAVLAINDDMASKTVRFGFHDTSSITDVVDGTYFELAPGSMVCSARSANNSTRSSHGTTFTLTANTFYIFEIYWTSTGSINYKIKSLDEATTHLNVDKTTDIPTGTSRLFGAGLVATSTILATDNLLVIDYMGHGFKNKR